MLSEDQQAVNIPVKYANHSPCMYDPRIAPAIKQIMLSTKNYNIYIRLQYLHDQL